MADHKYDENPPRRPGQPGAADQHRPGPSPVSAHPTGPNAPYWQETEGTSGPKGDSRGQYAKGHASPNPEGVHSANPVSLSGDGDATQGNGHGRERESKGTKAG